MLEHWPQGPLGVPPGPPSVLASLGHCQSMQKHWAQMLERCNYKGVDSGLFCGVCKIARLNLMQTSAWSLRRSCQLGAPLPPACVQKVFGHLCTTLRKPQPRNSTGLFWCLRHVRARDQDLACPGQAFFTCGYCGANAHQSHDADSWKVTGFRQSYFVIDT